MEENSIYGGLGSIVASLLMKINLKQLNLNNGCQANVANNTISTTSIPTNGGKTSSMLLLPKT